MYEFAIAAKYLMPRWRQLSASIISLVSVLVIAVVVWLIVVFFSVTNGLTSSWIDKLIALTAPVRITPTAFYHQSYYHLADSISGASGYSLKTIGEKRNSLSADPYNPDYDEEVPSHWPSRDLRPDGELRDPVQEAFAAIQTLQGIPGLSANDYEMTLGNLRLRLLRQTRLGSYSVEQAQNFLSQSSYLGSLDPENGKLLQALSPISMADLSNLLSVLSVRAEDSLEDSPSSLQLDQPITVQKRLQGFFANVTIDALVTPEGGWLIPRKILPASASWQVLLINHKNLLNRIVVPQEKTKVPSVVVDPNFTSQTATLLIDNGSLTLRSGDGEEMPLPPYAKIYLEEGALLPATVVASSIEKARDASTVHFDTHFSIQGSVLTGEIRYGNLQIGKASAPTLLSRTPQESPFWVYGVTSSGGSPEFTLPSIEGFGDGILLPKSFKASGALLGDTGYLSYFAPTASSVQEQRIPVFVAGFYDPGIIPIGAKYLLTSKEITSLIRSFYDHEEASFSNGINVRFDNPTDADYVKEELEKAFQAAGIASYWKIETYKDYEFTRDIIQQLQSEKRLFTLLATLIIIVACSNIISMLIILVNDKKLEIGILRSMGATSLSIALIFGTCGVVMGAVGSLIGILAALLTLENIQGIVHFIGRLQGYEMFNPVFYGETLPSEISLEALTFVIISTAAVSLFAGIIPAIKASLLKPAAILKAE